MRNHKADGLTLIELLVSLAIGTILIAAIFGVLENARQVQKVCESRTDLLQSVRISLSQIERDLRAVVLRTDDTQFQFAGRNDTDSNLPNDSVEFASLAGSPLTSLLTTGDLLRVGYHLEISEEAEQRGLIRTATSMPLAEEISPEQEALARRLYCPWAVGLEVSYYDPLEETWVEEWQERTDLPSSVRVVLYVSPEATDLVESERTLALENSMSFSTMVHLSLAEVALGEGQLGAESEQDPGTGGGQGTAPGGEGAR